MYVVEKRIVFEWDEVKEVQEIFLEVKRNLKRSLRENFLQKHTSDTAYLPNMPSKK